MSSTSSRTFGPLDSRTNPNARTLPLTSSQTITKARWWRGSDQRTQKSKIRGPSTKITSTRRCSKTYQILFLRITLFTSRSSKSSTSMITRSSPSASLSGKSKRTENTPTSPTRPILKTPSTARRVTSTPIRTTPRKSNFHNLIKTRTIIFRRTPSPQA